MAATSTSRPSSLSGLMSGGQARGGAGQANVATALLPATNSGVAVVDLEAGGGPSGPSSLAPGTSEPGVSWFYMHQQQAEHQRLLFGVYRWIMGMFLVMMFMGTLPSAVLLWTAVGCIFLAALLRMYLWRQLARAVTGWDLLPLTALRQGGGGDGFLRALGEGSTPLDLLNLRLSLVDRDFDSADYDLLLALDQSLSMPASRPPVTDIHLASLPIHIHAAKLKTRKQVEARGSYQSWGKDGGEEDEVCTVCLDDISDGDKVMTLPCHHRFHADCIKPWLKQQGLSAPCPICKVKVFA